MFKNASRAIAVAALVPIALMLSAVPGHAQEEEGDVTVDGVVTCDTTTGTYSVEWTIDNQTTVVIPERQAQAVEGEQITITSAVQSEALTGSVLDDVTPNPIPAFSQATFTEGPIPNIDGQVTLTTTWQSETNEGTAIATIGIPGTCLVVVATTTTAPAAEAEAVEADPAFTG